MRSGVLRDRVTIATLTRADDGEGGSVVTTPALTAARVPAQVRSLRSDERLAGAGTETEATHVVTIRAVPGVGRRTRFTWGTRVLDMVGPPIEQQHGRVYECLCVERVVS